MSAKWVVPKEALEATIDLIEPVPTRNGIKSSEFIKVSKYKNNGASFHLESVIGSKALLITGEKFPFENDLFLDRRLFVPFVNGGKESKSTDYFFIGKEDSLIVKHGNRRAVYAYAKPITGYVEPLGLETANVTPIGKKWSGLVDCAANIASPDPVTPSLNCVYVTQRDKYIEVMATDGILLFYGKAQSDKKPLKGDIAFPLDLVKALRQEGATKVVWNNKVAVVDFPKGKIWQAVKTKARKDFPYKDIRKFRKDAVTSPVVCSIPANTFVKASDRMSGYVGALDAADLALEVHLTKGSKKVQLVSGVADSKFNELIYATTEAKNDLVLEWPLFQVLPVILFAKDEGNIYIHLSKTGASCISTKSLTLIIGPRSK